MSIEAPDLVDSVVVEEAVIWGTARPWPEPFRRLFDGAAMTSAVGLQLLIDLDPHSGKTFDIIREAAAVTIALSDQFCIVKCPKTIGTGVLGPTFYDSNGEP